MPECPDGGTESGFGYFGVGHATPAVEGFFLLCLFRCISVAGRDPHISFPGPHGVGKHFTREPITVEVQSSSRQPPGLRYGEFSRADAFQRNRFQRSRRHAARIGGELAGEIFGISR